MNHIGTHRIDTPRLILRKAILTDAEPMYNNWANDPNVTRYLTWPPHSNSDVSRMVISDWIAKYERQDFYQWMITLKEDETNPIGSISVVSIDPAANSVELGYCIGKTWWRKGIMTEALNGAMEFLFDKVKVNRIEARHDINNPNSGGVMKKCGMEYEATLRKAGWNNQGVCDLCIYAKLASKK